MSNAVVEYIYHNTFSSLEKDNIIKHNHSCFELVYFVEGKGETTVDSDETVKYSPNKYVIYKPFAYHDEKHYTETRVKGFGFTIAFDHIMAPEPGIYDDKSQRILTLINQMQEEMTQKLPLHDAMMNAYLCMLLTIHYRNNKPCSEKENVVKNVIAYLDENYHQRILVKDLANMSGYSYDRFRHIFKDAMGVSVVNYILHKRITHAKKLLRQSSLTITEIAFQSGFGSASEFNNMFKRKMGISPRQYRKQQNDVQNITDTLSQIIEKGEN